MNKQPSNILIVDDEPYICQLLSRYLTAEGYNCSMAPAGEEALKALENDSFQLVLADIIMPGMSGIDLLNLIRTLYPDIGVIMVTGVDDRDTGILAVELGAYGYIIKPFERNEILINVANALERQRLAISAKEKSSNQVSKTQPITLKRRPIKIPAKEIADLIKSGIDDGSLMEKFNLSAKALHSLLDQLIAAKVLTQSEVDIRGSLSPGSVVIDFGEAKFPETTKVKPVINATDAANCIRCGMDDSLLMKRYGLSAKGVRSLLRKLVASGIMQQSELDKRMSETHDWAIIDQSL